MFDLVYTIFHYTSEFEAFLLSWTFNITLYVEYPMLTCFRAFLEDFMIQCVAFPFRILILYSKFTQSHLELKVGPKYLNKILKILTGSFFAEVFSAKHFPSKLFVISISKNLF